MSCNGVVVIACTAPHKLGLSDLVALNLRFEENLQFDQLFDFIRAVGKYFIQIGNVGEMRFRDYYVSSSRIGFFTRLFSVLKGLIRLNEFGQTQKLLTNSKIFLIT